MRASIVCLVLMCWGMAAQQPAGAGISHTARPQAEDWVLANQHLRVVLRSDNLTLSVEDLATEEAWGSDPWEASAGRIYLLGKGHQLENSFDQVAEIVHDLKYNLGVDRALIRIAGWSRKGYDNDRLIDQLQVNTEAGKAINDVLSPLQRRLAHEELLNHQTLTPDLLVERTNFSSGVEVTVNYGEFPFKLKDGTELPPYGYRVKDAAPGGHSFSGHVETDLVSKN
jgi:hypothetical protein